MHDPPGLEIGDDLLDDVADLVDLRIEFFLPFQKVAEGALWTTALAAAVVIERRTCSCWRGERPDPAEILIAARRLAGARPHLGCRGWDRASRGPVAVVPR